MDSALLSTAAGGIRAEQWNGSVLTEQEYEELKKKSQNPQKREDGEIHGREGGEVGCGFEIWTGANLQAMRNPAETMSIEPRGKEKGMPEVEKNKERCLDVKDGRQTAVVI